MSSRSEFGARYDFGSSLSAALKAFKAVGSRNRSNKKVGAILPGADGRKDAQDEKLSREQPSLGSRSGTEDGGLTRELIIIVHHVHRHHVQSIPDNRNAFCRATLGEQVQRTKIVAGALWREELIFSVDSKDGHQIHLCLFGGTENDDSSSEFDLDGETWLDLSHRGLSWHSLSREGKPAGQILLDIFTPEDLREDTSRPSRPEMKPIGDAKTTATDLNSNSEILDMHCRVEPSATGSLLIFVLQVKGEPCPTSSSIVCHARLGTHIKKSSTFSWGDTGPADYALLFNIEDWVDQHLHITVLNDDKTRQVVGETLVHVLMGGEADRNWYDLTCDGEIVGQIEINIRYSRCDNLSSTQGFPLSRSLSASPSEENVDHTVINDDNVSSHLNKHQPLQATPEVTEATTAPLQQNASREMLKSVSANADSFGSSADLSMATIGSTIESPFHSFGVEFSHTEYQSYKFVPLTTIKQLGHGSLGSVDAVFHIDDESKTPFARKVIRLPNMSRRRLLPLIQQEVAVLRSLEHRHIVQVVSTYETNSVPRQFGILLSPAGDEDLSHYLERVGENDFPEESCNLLKSWPYCLASAVAYVHSQSIRHKDIKPSNIIRKGADVFLTDFGSAHEFKAGLTSSTEGYAVGITKMYSAPEVISHDRRGRSSDIYSLGCVFAEMSTVANGRKIEDFHDFRSEPVPNEPDRMTLAYHATGHKLEDWFAMQDDKWSESLIAKMLSQDKHLRPSATEVMALLPMLPGKTTCSCRLLTYHNLDIKGDDLIGEKFPRDVALSDLASSAQIKGSTVQLECGKDETCFKEDAPLELDGGPLQLQPQPKEDDDTHSSAHPLPYVDVGVSSQKDWVSLTPFPQTRSSTYPQQCLVAQLEHLTRRKLDAFVNKIRRDGVAVTGDMKTAWLSLQQREAESRVQEEETRWVMEEIESADDAAAREADSALAEEMARMDK